MAAKNPETRRRASIRLRDRRMRIQGMPDAAIAAKLEIDLGELLKLRAKEHTPGKNDLNPKLWREFVESHTWRDRDGIEETRVNDRPMNEAHTRAHFRWLKEGSSCSVFTADRFLCAVGLHLDDFWVFCDEQGGSPWATGREPDWHRVARAPAEANIFSAEREEVKEPMNPDEDQKPVDAQGGEELGATMPAAADEEVKMPTAQSSNGGGRRARRSPGRPRKNGSNGTKRAYTKRNAFLRKVIEETLRPEEGRLKRELDEVQRAIEAIDRAARE
jgi:hypothetical protein